MPTLKNTKYKEQAVLFHQATRCAPNESALKMTSQSLVEFSH